ncbi:MAG: hypothetical protein E7453_01625 [Ruminococcaceae bacterium]|nr:hypothetical protein [Oscillospiraceae bacterium]
MKVLWKILSAFLAILLSIVLVVSLIALPVVSFLTENADPSKLVKAVFESGLLNELGQPAANYRPILLSGDYVIGELPDGATIEDLIEGTLPPEINIDALPEGATLPSEIPDNVIDNLPELELPEGVDMEELFGAVADLVESGVIDVEELMTELEIPEDAVVNTDQMVQELTQSSAVQALVSTYAEDIINAATGSGEAPKLTTESVLEILNPHMEEIVTIVEKNLPEEVEIDKEKLINAVEKVTSSALPTIVETLPPAKDVAQTIVQSMPEELTMILDALKMIRSGNMQTIAIVAVAALLALLFLLRLPTINGLRWMGVNGLISAVFVGALGYVLQAPFFLELLASLPASVLSLATPLIAALASTFVTFAIIYGVTGLVLIVGNGVLNAVLTKKTPKAQAE